MAVPASTRWPGMDQDVMGDYEAGRDSFRFNPGGGRDTIQGSGGDRLEIASAATSAAIESADGIPFIFRGFDATGAEIERIEITGAALFDSLMIDAPLATGGPGAGAGGGLSLAPLGAGIGAGAYGGLTLVADAGIGPGTGGAIGLAGERITAAGAVTFGGGTLITASDHPFG